jgi:predicted ABC-class ATPase
LPLLSTYFCPSRRNELINLNSQDLREKLNRIDGRSYKEYKSIAGPYSYPQFMLFIDYVQGDPFAGASRIRLQAEQQWAGFPQGLFNSKIRKTALEDFIGRQTAAAIDCHAKGRRGTGKSGLIFIQKHGQEILERTAVKAGADSVEIRISIGLPAAGRRVLAHEAIQMLFDEIPRIAEDSLFYRAYDQNRISSHVDLFEDQEFLRNELTELKLVSFIKEDSVLPRKTGVSNKPMPKEQVVPFRSPESLKTAVDLPHRGQVEGMGIPEGIALIVGGGYHGKTTLLKAIERGVYNHICGDGREMVITRRDAVKIRAEDGRRIEKVDISPFIRNLPCPPLPKDLDTGKKPRRRRTDEFSTEDASGSTSQAANIVEALEIGTTLLLIDEDTSATNFMIRDERMQELVSKDKEPITPFIDKARSLNRDLGVSSIIVIGGSGDYFDIADTVIMMDEYTPVDVTARALEIAKSQVMTRISESGPNFARPVERFPQRSLCPQGESKFKVKSRGLHSVEFGRQTIDLSYLEQLVDENQTRAIAQIMLYACNHHLDGKTAIKEIIIHIMQEIGQKGLDILSVFPGHPGEFALPRHQEIAAAINRMRTLQVVQKK